MDSMGSGLVFCQSGPEPHQPTHLSPGRVSNSSKSRSLCSSFSAGAWRCSRGDWWTAPADLHVEERQPAPRRHPPPGLRRDPAGSPRALGTARAVRWVRATGTGCAPSSFSLSRGWRVGEGGVGGVGGNKQDLTLSVLSVLSVVQALHVGHTRSWRGGFRA